MRSLDGMRFTTNAPTEPGRYLCRYVCGYEFEVLVVPGPDGRLEAVCVRPPKSRHPVSGPGSRHEAEWLGPIVGHS